MGTKKKRTKRHKGNPAAARPTIIKLNAVRRNPVHQWWIDNRRLAKPALIAAGVVLIIIVCLVGIIGIIAK